MNNGKSFVITKTSEDQQIVFGWANVAIRKDGTVVEDLQNDIIEPEELEKAAYEYVLNFRDAGEKHDPGLRQKGKLVESVVFTKEKIAAMGLPENSVPIGWWVGYKIADRAAWEKIKSGEYRSFSVEGRGERVPVEVVRKAIGNQSERIAKTFSEVFAKFPQYHGCRLSKTDQPALTFSEKAGKIKTGSFAARSFSEILRKFNPYHDSLGRFTFRGGSVSFSPGSGIHAERAIARENVRRKNEGLEGNVGGAYYNAGKKTWAEQVTEGKARENAKANETQKVKFTPAKTKKEAVEYATKNLGFSSASYGSKMDIETINHINEQITKIQAKYPETKGAVQTLKTNSKSTSIAQIVTLSDGTARLEFSSKHYGNGLKELEAHQNKNVESGWAPKGTTAKDIVWHEYGHVLANISSKNSFGIKPTDTIPNIEMRKSFIQSRRSGKPESQWINDAAKSLGKTTKEISFGISRYAMTDHKEAFAEAFAEVNGSPSPRPEAIALVKASGYYK